MEKFRHKAALRILTTVFGVGLLAGTASARDDEATLKALYETANSAGEREVVVYNPNTNANTPIFDAFSKRFPNIKIVGVDLFGPKLTTRLEAEAASGQAAGDVLYGTATEMPGYGSRGFLVSYTPRTAAGIHQKYIGQDSKWFDWTLTVSGPFYNKAYLKAAEAPKSWLELADPKWRKQLSISTLQSASGTGQALTALTLAGKIDRAWFQRLAVNQPVVSQGNAQAIQAVASGQATIGLDVPYHFFKAAAKKGAPFEFIFPTEGVISIPLNEALLDKAPHPNAAKLFINWLFSTEAQALLAEIGMQGTMPDAPKVAGAPDGLVFNVLDWRTLITQFPAQLAMYKEVFAN
ncbi:iron(III) transport system substrate-binding protein [Neorhizobium galegae]|uniref:ABC transporter substrate-binding protein n=1 Tax=Neorhizobium galegae TaxID=399 RepID=UPI002780A018|nr:extracellular solute-binding protein [Neorhizobium galegae]MDQ0137791.1 iron(III) transport system substrate-binding protein [Neorhizobium galegae]